VIHPCCDEVDFRRVVETESGHGENPVNLVIYAVKNDGV